MASEDYLTSRYLTEQQREALDAKRQRNIGRTVLAWQEYAHVQGYDESQIQEKVAEINSLTLGQLKKLRKTLVAAVKLDELITLPKRTVDPEVLTEGTGEEKPVLISVVPKLDAPSRIEESITTEEDNKDTPIVTAPLIESHEPTSVDEGAEFHNPNDLPESAKAWVTKLLGENYEMKGKDVREIAQHIYVTIGSPRTRKQPDGSRVDPIERIVLRLEGKSNIEIAKLFGISRNAVDQWFRNFVDKRALKLIIDESEVQAEKNNPSAELETSQSADFTESDESVPETTLVSTPAPIAPASIMPTSHEKTQEWTDHIKLAKQWAKELDFEDDDELVEALTDVFNPQFHLELNGVHKRTKHMLREHIKKTIPNIQADEYGLSSAQLARINRMLGRERTPEGDVYKGAPVSVREVCLDHGFFVEQRREEILGALSQLLNGSVGIISMVETERHTDDAFNILLEQGFTDEEISHLKTCIQFGENKEHASRPEPTKQALKKLQKLLAINGKNLDESDPLIKPSITMLTNVATGVKTIDHVFYKLKGKREDITRRDVEALIEEGIITLAK